MSLRDVALREDRTYNSLRDDPAQTLLVPCLREALSYDRAVGYFRSSVFRVIGSGVNKLVARGGKIRLIASPHLDENDLEQINRGYDARALENAIGKSIKDELERASEVERLQLGYLGQLIADGVLDFKIAVTQVGGQVGLYHDKFGVITDAHAAKLTFLGSNNETYNAYRVNSETFTVHCSWDGSPSNAIAHRLEQDFEQLWNGQLPQVQTMDLPEVAAERLRELAAQLPPDYSPDEPTTPPSLPPSHLQPPDLPEPEVRGPGLRVPDGVTLRDYQENAITSWFANQHRGILKMATGTGKTLTALGIASRLCNELHDAKQPLLLVVVCPYRHLVDQWAEEVGRFGASSLRCYEGRALWRNDLVEMVQRQNLGGVQFDAVVATTDTFRGSEFQTILKGARRGVLLIGDEVHNFGSRQVITKLPDHIRYRLGLSATPERFDEEETQAIYSYFGPVIFELDLKRAIEMGALSRYRYVIIPTYLNAEEMEKYTELAREIGRLYAIRGDGGGIDDAESGLLGQLLGERAMVLGHCEQKISAFRKQVMGRINAMHQLVYCAEGRPPLRDGDDPQIDIVQRMLGIELDQRVQKYVSQTPRDERAVLLQRFSLGTDLKFLLSMRCLDEGVDLPDARVAYLLASSRNPRQSIQRRGRVLRNPSNGQQKTAEIIDFLALPNRDILLKADTDADLSIEKKLIVQELERARDFAELASNSQEALGVLDELLGAYGLEGEQ